MTFMGIGAGSNFVIEAKTANYGVVPQDHGKIFTNEGAGSSGTFTLPAIADVQDGWNVAFFGAADVSIKVSSAEGSNMVAYNNASGSSVSFATASELVGGYLLVVKSPADQWLVIPGLGNDGQSVTVTA